MTDSKLLKDAIADAHAIKETAIANAKIALEEAFTPRIQSMLSEKLSKDLDEGQDLDSSEIGGGVGSSDSGTDSKKPSGVASSAHTKLDPETDDNESEIGSEDDNSTVVDDLEEGEVGTGDDSDDGDHKADGTPVDPTNADDAELEEVDENLDLDSVISELEAELSKDDDDEDEDEEVKTESKVKKEEEEMDYEDETDVVDESKKVKKENDDYEEDDYEEDDVDLDEILREMGYGDDEDDDEDEGDKVEETKVPELEAKLSEAYDTIKTLQESINEVNLLNAKLLYATKLFRSYNLTNEQKERVVETIDRSNSVREVKLVFATLAESMKFNANRKPVKSKITEGFASKDIASTRPAKEIITEENEHVKRFKELAFGNTNAK